MITPDIPPPTCPTPRAEETQIGRITITLEQIKIIQFCLKICDPWTLLHTYRLGLMCRWGVSYDKWHFYVFDQKKCSCDPPIKNFLVFALDPTRPCLDCQLRAILTSQPIYDPFKFDFEWRPKCKIGLNVNLPKNHQAERNLKYTLGCSNVFSTNHQWHWIPIIDYSWFNSMLYPPPVQCQNYSSGHKSETDQPNKF